MSIEPGLQQPPRIGLGFLFGRLERQIVIGPVGEAQAKRPQHPQIAGQPSDGPAPPARALRRRVRKRKATLVTIPRSHPSTALATMIHTSEACPEPTTQLSCTWRVLATTSAIRTTISAMRLNAEA